MGKIFSLRNSSGSGRIENVSSHFSSYHNHTLYSVTLDVIQPFVQPKSQLLSLYINQDSDGTFTITLIGSFYLPFRFFTL